MALLIVASCATSAPRTVAMISASAEWKTIADRYPAQAHTPYGDFVEGVLGGERVIFFHGGYGKVNAAGSTQYAIDRWHPQLVLNLGTCGAFGHDLHVGDIVLANATTIYDIYEAMGDADEAIAEFKTTLDTSRWPAQLASRVHVEPLVSADRDLIPAEIAKLRAKYNAGAGDWESGAIAFVATKNHTRVAILRGVTDVIDEAHSDPTYNNVALWQQETVKVMATLLALAADALPALLR
ncbi:MAG TPA: 5'-methylthioadenosine/S-adenosylhomocysteine nucleosidase [Kofleriaceae bacterium]|nr:5'-methylthioadenosine/S-adenosylhomocysteine nucleosidase [Kofleriaceae bacterium]